MSEMFFKILTVSISMTPIIFAMIILTPVFNKNYKSGWKYWMWLFISIRLILPFSLGGEPQIHIKLPIAETMAERLTSGNVADLEAISINNNIVNAVETQSFNFNLIEAVAVIYFAVVVIYLLFKMINYIIFRKNIEKWCSEPAAEIVKISSDIGELNGIKAKKLNLRICKIIPSPMVMGIFRPMLLLPNEEYDYIKLKMILSHEIVHIKRHDTLYKLLLMIVCAIHWFNPFVHIMSKKANSDMELSCDAKALQNADSEEKKIYSIMIIDMASQSYSKKLPQLFTSFGSSKESLEVRIKNICSFSNRKEGNIILVLVILIALLFGTAIQIGNFENNRNGLNPLNQLENTNIGINIGKDNSKEIENETEKNLIESDKKINEDLNQEPNGEINNNSQLPNTNVQNDLSQQTELSNDINESSETAEIVIIDLNQLDNND